MIFISLVEPLRAKYRHVYLVGGKSPCTCDDGESGFEWFARFGRNFIF